MLPAALSVAEEEAALAEEEREAVDEDEPVSLDSALVAVAVEEPLVEEPEEELVVETVALEEEELEL